MLEAGRKLDPATDYTEHKRTFDMPLADLVSGSGAILRSRERFVGVSGQAEGLPQLPDGQFLPPMHLSCGEQPLKKTARDKFNRTLTIGRVAILTQNLNGRPKCHYCGPCSRGCTTGSCYSSPASTLPAAEATGRLTLIPNAIASHLLTDANGKCRGVYYVDRVTRNHREVAGKIVVLCASTLESTRIMLNSKSPRHPNGIANSSGVLGHYLMDHVMGGGADGVLPVLRGVEDTRGNRPNGVYIARFRNITEKHPGFLARLRVPGLVAGEQVRAHIRAAGVRRRLQARGEAAAALVDQPERLCRVPAGVGNFCELDKNKVDAWASLSFTSRWRSATTNGRWWKTWGTRPRRCCVPLARKASSDERKCRSPVSGSRPRAPGDRLVEEYKAGRV